MLRFFSTLLGRVTLQQLLLHAVLPPLLFLALDRVVERSLTETFRHEAGAYAASLVDELQSSDLLESRPRIVRFLDGAIEGGPCLYATAEVDGHLVGSSLTETPADLRQLSGASGNTYALKLRFHRDTVAGTLYLGFDESHTQAEIRTARLGIIGALVAYAVLSLVFSLAAARRVTRPLEDLRGVAARVAAGEPNVHLEAPDAVTEVAALAQSLEHMRVELVGAAAHIAREVEQRELERSRRKALESKLQHEDRLATLGTFAGGIAHEFNNILVPLLLFTEQTLEDMSPSDPARDSLERVLVAATRAKHVVARMLSFSRPSTERPLEPLDLGAAVEEALGLVTAIVPPSVAFHRDLGAAGRRILGDPTSVAQIVVNLCSNALRAMEGRSGALTVRLRESAGTEPRLEVRVEDTGRGMSAAELERIFEPFYTTREVGHGTGLGLSVVQGLITRLDGRIEVSSEPGRGTEFTVSFPMLDT